MKNCEREEGGKREIVREQKDRSRSAGMSKKYGETGGKNRRETAKKLGIG